MNLKDDKIEKYKALKPIGINYIYNISMTRVNIKGYKDLFNLDLILQSQSMNKIKMKFSMVKDIKLSNLSYMLDVSLDIINIKDHQLDGIKYKVQDVEEEVISFYCKDIDSIELID